MVLRHDPEIELAQSGSLPLNPSHGLLQDATLPVGSVGSPWAAAVTATWPCTELLRAVLQEFWGVPVTVRFMGISDQAHYYWRMDDFHVSQLSLENAAAATEQESVPATALLRLSDTTCSILLERVLGRLPSSKPFTFHQISPLEANILNEFSRDIFSCLRKPLFRKVDAQASVSLIHLIWLIGLNDEQGSPPIGMPSSSSFQPGEGDALGKLILSLPAAALRVESKPNAPTEPAVSDRFFYHVQTMVRVAVGQTRMTLADINQLERDDMVVLEQSRADTLFLIVPESGERLPFQAKIRQRAQISIPDMQQEFDTMQSQTHGEMHSQGGSGRQAMWDNLMIDVSAEFEPVKLPLKQLKQMSEGLIVEMGDLIHNQVSLQVEGKTLAWGELIIVGDKFGIRVNRLQSEPEPAAEPEVRDSGVATAALETPAAPTEAASAGSSTTPTGVPGTEEENNLDNFLNEDFDGAFEEEEDW